MKLKNPPKEKRGYLELKIALNDYRKTNRGGLKIMMILKCRLTTVETMLGTASNNKELHSEFIASHAPDAKSRAEEIEAVGVEEMIENYMKGQVK